MSEKILDTIRQGEISGINYPEGRVRVVYHDKNGAVTQELPLQSFEYDMPKVGDQVYVAHQSNSIENGIVLSRYFNDGNMPKEHGAHIHRKEYGEDAFMRYDRNKEILTLNFKNIVITGDVMVKGDLKVKGNLKVEQNARIDGVFEADGNVLFMQNAEVMGSALVSGDLETKNNLTVGRNAEVKRDMHVAGHFIAAEGDIPDMPYEAAEPELVPKEIEEIEDIE